MRIATFNVENLFSRAKALNLASNEATSRVLARVSVLQALLEADDYDALAIQEAFAAVRTYVDIRVDRGQLFNRQGQVVARSRADWQGVTEFKQERFSDAQRENTARVLKAVKPDIVGLVEVESLPVLRAFNSALLSNRFRHHLLVDAFDPRGIDVALATTRHPIGWMRSHMFSGQKRAGSPGTFSRDCLQAEVDVGADQPIHVLVNHFLSKHGGDTPQKQARRAGQAQAVADLLSSYDLDRDWVVVMGDFNDTPESTPLRSLTAHPGLHDVLGLAFGEDPAARWTYHYRGAYNQIDFLLVSSALRSRWIGAGLERRGIAQLEKLTGGEQKSWPSVDSWRTAASDHAAVWADFDLSG